MVRHWFTVRDSGWWWRAAVNAFGGLLTLVVLLVVASVKFVDGAWLVLVLIPVAGRAVPVHPPPVRRRPRAARAAPRPGRRGAAPRGAGRHPGQRPQPRRRPGGQRRPLDRRRRAGRARRRRPRLRGGDPREPGSARCPGVPLVVVESPYRALTGPLLAYLDVLDQAWPPDKETPITFVVIPEYVPRHWWERLLYNQSTNQLRRALLGRPNTVVTNVPYRREEAEAFRRRRRSRRPAGRRDAGVRHGAGGAIVCGARRQARRAHPAARTVTRRTPASRGRQARPRLPPRRRGAQRRPVRRRGSSRLVLELGQADPRRGRRRPRRRDRLDPAARRQRRRDQRGGPAGPRHRPRRQAEHATAYRSRRSSSRPATSARRSSTRRWSATPTCWSLGLPYRKRFGGDFAIGRTVPYVLKNAPCAVWVAREPMPEEYRA